MTGHEVILEVVRIGKGAGRPEQVDAGTRSRGGKILLSRDDLCGRVPVVFSGNRHLGDEFRKRAGGRGHEPAGTLLGLDAIGVRDTPRREGRVSGSEVDA